MGYDPSTGRMLQVDPYASSYASHTTYNYAVNNPVMMNDPNGGQTQAPGYGGGYVYSNAAADRLYKINNPDAYTEAWAQDFGAYTSQFDEDKPPLIPGAIRVPKDMFASIVDAVGNGGELEFNNGKIGYWKDYDNDVATGDNAVEAKRSKFITLFGKASIELPDVTDKFNKQLNETNRFFTQMAEVFDGMDLEPLATHIVKLAFFKEMIGTNKKFDIKQPGKPFSRSALGGPQAIWNGRIYNYDDFGNINYGLAARAFGISIVEAIEAAGYNQTFETKKPDWLNIPALFDHRRDTMMIVLGYYMEMKK